MVESFCRALLMSVGLVHLMFRMRNFLHFLLAFYLVSPLVDASVAMQETADFAHTAHPGGKVAFF